MLTTASHSPLNISELEIGNHQR